MKKLFILTVILACCQIASAEGLTTWIFGGAGDGPTNEVFARVGYEKGSLEIGGTVCFWPNYSPPTVYGVYAIGKLDNLVQIPNPLPIEWLPETIGATPYLGGQVSVDFEDRGSMIGPVAGVILQEVLTIEYQYRNYGQSLGDIMADEHRVLFGLRYAF